MHELGLCDALLRMVKDISVKEELTQVQSITLEIGELSGVVPAYMSDCWTAVVDGTPFKNTALHIETVPGVARCLDCEEEFRIDMKSLRCPFCQSDKLMPISGNDMTLKEIEAS